VIVHFVKAATPESNQVDAQRPDPRQWALAVRPGELATANGKDTLAQCNSSGLVSYRSSFVPKFDA
jgi:hypothetical protein